MILYDRKLFILQLKARGFNAKLSASIANDVESNMRDYLRVKKVRKEKKVNEQNPTGWRRKRKYSKTTKYLFNRMGEKMEQYI